MGDLVNILSWSVSRHRVFNECRRAYYYRHYGSWGGWDEDADPRTRDLYVLKNMGNRFTLAGKAVHEVVADSLNRHRYGGVMSLEEAKAKAYRLLADTFTRSRAKEYLRDPKGAPGLLEHEYPGPATDADWVRMRERVYRCLDNFYASEIREIILRTRIENWLPIDKLDSFLFEGTTVYVAPDFALKNPHGNAMVIDWKTGRTGTAADRVQLVCYGLYAKEKWGVDPERAIGELHYLLTGEHDIVTLDQAALDEGTALIRKSISDMREALSDPDTNTAEEERFARVDNPTLCQRCNYRRVCWPRWDEGERPAAPGA